MLSIYRAPGTYQLERLAAIEAARARRAAHPENPTASAPERGPQAAAAPPVALADALPGTDSVAAVRRPRTGLVLAALAAVLVLALALAIAAPAGATGGAGHAAPVVRVDPVPAPTSLPFVARCR
ncbi:MAG TPA: hypothetical protein VH482_21060 [Thermomicrobiales bacterium]|jgi:hypothetical protein